MYKHLDTTTKDVMCTTKLFLGFMTITITHDILGSNLADAHMREKYPKNGHTTRTGGLAPLVGHTKENVKL